ncbi:hypothetical protein [Clostridium thermarum]|uniref:hypothetical protein n=1 Tax=Clostridium thermarum TaxID=1716543 RepID=UPI0013D5F922|nr:hypothetical protein [Clostridium thermarum]
MARSIMGNRYKRLNAWRSEISNSRKSPYKDTEHYIASLERTAHHRVNVPKSLI